MAEFMVAVNCCEEVRVYLFHDGIYMDRISNVAMAWAEYSENESVVLSGVGTAVQGGQGADYRLLIASGSVLIQPYARNGSVGAKGFSSFILLNNPVDKVFFHLKRQE
jgi:hypothetical protein